VCWNIEEFLLWWSDCEQQMERFRSNGQCSTSQFQKEGILFSMHNQDKIQRTVLPIPDRPHTGLTTYDAKDPNTKFPPIEPLRPPKGAPNVLIVLLDDVGFGASSAFGGPCDAQL
jgi:hypothetical protein